MALWAICLAVVMLPVDVAPAAAAGPDRPGPLAECEKDPGIYYYTGSHYRGWQVSDVYSQWIAGPGEVSFTLTETVTNAIEVNISGTASASLVIASMSNSIGVSFSQQTTKTWGWSYMKQIPSGVTARAVVQKRGEKANITKHTISSSCTNSYVYGSATAPYTSTATSQYCISLDSWPETKWDQTSGGCRDH